MTLQKLKEYEGKTVEFYSRGKYRKYKLIAVQTKDEIMVRDGIYYRGKIGDFRLEYIDGKDREWNGFWTNKISKIKTVLS